MVRDLDDKPAQTGPDSFASKADAEAYARKHNEAEGIIQKVHSIEITPEMKRSVMKEGQPSAKNETPSWKSAVMSSIRPQAA